MDDFLSKRIKLSNLFIYLLAFYPLLKFNISSIILSLLFLSTFYDSYRNRTLSFAKKDIKRFFFYSLYILIIFISVFYSENANDAIKRTTRLVPLLLLPATIIFCKLKIEDRTRNSFLNIFLITNLLYVITLFSVYNFHIKNTGITSFTFAGLVSNRDIFQYVLDEYLGKDVLNSHKAYFSMGFVILCIFSINQSFKYFNAKKVLSFVYGFTFFVFFFLILYFFSFPNVIALFLSIIIFIIHKFKNTKANKASLYVLSLIFSSFIIFSIHSKSEDIDVKRGLNFIESVFKSKNVELNDPRIEIYKSINSFYKKANWKEVFFGIGIGDVQDKLNEEYAIRLKNIDSENMLLFSEEFDDDYWFKNNIDVIPNTIKSPFGNIKPDRLQEHKTTIKSSFNVSKKVSLRESEIYTFSIFAKQEVSENLILRLGSIKQRIVFDLKNGVFKVFSNKVKGKIKKYGEWYRCSITTQIKEEDVLALIGISNNSGEYKYFGSNKALYVWGAQLEEGAGFTEYKKNDSELLKYVSDRSLNTHNNYLYFLLAGGIICLISFFFIILKLFIISLKNKNIYQVTFCVIIALNFLTENILSRHLGLVFVSFMIFVFFTNNLNKIEK